MFVFSCQAAEQAAAMALHNPMIMQPMVAPPPTIPHPGNMVFVPQSPGMQFQPIRGPVSNSFVPMQVTRQSVHHQPRTQQAHPLPPTPSNSVPKKEKKEVQKAPVEKIAPAKQDEQSVPAVSAEATSRTQTQERPLSSSKPPGSRLAIRFNGP